MNYDEIAHLRSQHPAWVLLRSNNVALVLSFLGRVFVDGNASGIPASELADQLDDELFALNQRLGEDAFPRSATAYLDDWASPEHGWLRKYYPAGADEAHFDLAPADRIRYRHGSGSRVSASCAHCWVRRPRCGTSIRSSIRPGALCPSWSRGCVPIR
jgi:hypothetical protein